MKIFRQGDILVKEVSEIKGELSNNHILAFGEVTGHSHRIQGTVQVFRNNQETFLQVEEAELVHDEHEAITIPKGNYQVVIQREYSPISERQVMD